MKIYNKKKFLFGAFLLALGVLNGGLALWQQRFDWSAGVLVVAMLVMGGHSVLRSISQEATREDQLEASDERNQYITMKSHHKTYFVDMASYLYYHSKLTQGD